ncbi:MAG: hypothetical protein JO007_03580 [Alphaproteobacteria bacterium]|nr:hypothetical protein [Alphaproteobacteria bacterium]
MSLFLAFGLFGATEASAERLNTLHTFGIGSGDGQLPYGDLISDASGALYGTTANGGANGAGTVFKLAPPAIAGGSWTETILYSFTGTLGDGAQPSAGLISDTSGALYGTTTGGGSGSGTVFVLTPPAASGGSWTETVLYSFTGGSDGGSPNAALLSDASGALYGTTENGGSNNSGTAFKLVPATAAAISTCQADYNLELSTCNPYAPDYKACINAATHDLNQCTAHYSTETVLHSFIGGTSDGSNPVAALISDASGALYGTTGSGGTNNAGTVFKLTPHNPANPNSCQVAYNASVAICNANFNTATNLNLCAPTDTACQAYYNNQLSICLGQATTTLSACTPIPDDETLLHSFAGGIGDGSNPAARLTLDPSGALYGTMQAGGKSGYGTVFKLLPPTDGKWTEAVLRSFSGSDGAFPVAGLTGDASGLLYGVTAGDTSIAGTVFQLTAFTGVPGKANCTSQSLAFLAKKYGSNAAAAEALGYPSVAALQEDILDYCSE